MQAGLIGRSKSADSTPRAKRQAPLHSDDLGWVQIPTFNRWGHTGGRPWGKTDPCDKIQSRETTLKDSWLPKRLTCEPKITSGWEHESRTIKEKMASVKDFSNKVNVPDPET